MCPAMHKVPIDGTVHCVSAVRRNVDGMTALSTASVRRNLSNVSLVCCFNNATNRADARLSITLC